MSTPVALSKLTLNRPVNIICKVYWDTSLSSGTFLQLIYVSVSVFTFADLRFCPMLFYSLVRIIFDWLLISVYLTCLMNIFGVNKLFNPAASLRCAWNWADWSVWLQRTCRWQLLSAQPINRLAHLPVWGEHVRGPLWCVLSNVQPVSMEDRQWSAMDQWPHCKVWT